MKLKLHISSKSHLEPPAIIDRIMSGLKQKDYVAKIATSNRVTFTDDPWQALWNFDAVRRLDGGTFTISISDNSTIIGLEYYRIIIIQLVIFAAIIVFLLFYGSNLMVLLGILFYLVAIGIQGVVLTMIARYLLEDILGQVCPFFTM